MLTKFSALLVLLSVGVANSQISDKILSVKTGDANEGQPLTVEAELVGTVRIRQLLLAYRSFGSSEYKQIEMQLTGNTAKGTIPASEVVTLEMEYYFILRIEGQKKEETFPAENPKDRPFRVQIRTRSAKDEEIIFLSPEEGMTVSSDDLLISVSLLRSIPLVRRSATKLYINEQDVTQFAVMAEELITLVPENVTPSPNPGPQQVRVELYDTSGNLYHKKSISFHMVGPFEAAQPQTFLTYNLSATLEARNENIHNTSTPYNRANLTASSQYDILRVNGRLYVTNEEKSDRQPQNRYLIEAQIPWARLGYGDAYPTFPNLIMSGKRIRGLTTNIKYGFFNLDLAYGDVVRKISGDTIKTFSQSDTASLNNTQYAVGKFNNDSTYAWFKYGTFPRTLFVVRPGFTSEHFQLGISFLRGKDDVGSLRRDGVVYGIGPQENVAVGTDLLVALDDRRFELTVQGGASLLNQDIAKGNITDAEIDSLYKVIPGAPDSADNEKSRRDLRELRDKFSPYITVNQNLIPLSLDRLSSIFAYETALALNYFNNYLKASYIFRGSGYNSFGQTFIRKDIKGFNIFDRLRLMESQLFLSFGYELLQDNTDNSKQATTTFSNLNTSISYFPREDFPNVTVGYGYNQNANGIPTAPDTNLVAVHDATNRFFVQLGYGFSAGLRYNASLGVSTSLRDDRTRLNADTRSSSISGAVVTTWDIPLETSAGITLNLNELPELPQPRDPADSVRMALRSFNYTTVSLGGRYRLFEDNLRLWASLNPTLGDVERTTFDLGGEYFFYQNLSAILQTSFLQNPDATDVIWSLMLKYNL